MRRKIIEVGLIFIYTHVIYVTITYMEYMEYEYNRDMITYGVYLHRLITSLLIWHMWRREFDKNHKHFSHISCIFHPEVIIDYYSSYHPGISCMCLSYGTLVQLLIKCSYGNIQAYKLRMYHIVCMSQYWSICLSSSIT